MRTPAGKECRYFYGDYHRGHKREECRLLASALPPLNWTAVLCQDCPVPGILLNNGCPNLMLHPRLDRPFPFLRRRVQVTAFCTQTQRQEFDPNTGCGQCHLIPPEFSGEIS